MAYSIPMPREYSAGFDRFGDLQAARSACLEDHFRVNAMIKKASEQRTPLQHQAFVKAARDLGCDEDPAHFDEVLKKVARHKPVNQSNSKRVNLDEMKKPGK